MLVDFLFINKFYEDNVIDNLFTITSSLRFVEKEHGFEIHDFNHIIPGLEPIFSKILADNIIIDQDLSGIFRKPNLRIHFEGFDDTSEWIFAIALEETIFNLYHHLENGPLSDINSKHAIEDFTFNYNNLLEWNCYSNIILKPNQCVIFRPWLFHSFSHEKLIQLYRLKGN
jgi:hypothetical protein